MDLPDNEKRIKKTFFLLITISFFLRLFLAYTFELGNDEVYYWTYALFPDLSHFDHPPMVGFFIQLFSLNLTFHSELFIRLAAVVVGTINTYLIFLIARKIKNSLAGLYAAFLYTASIYGFVVNGLFILPDAPLSLFWLIDLYLFVHILPDEELTKKNRLFLLLSGVVTGLAMLSKYNAIFLWGSMFLFILRYNRRWFKAKELYFALLISVVLFIPVIIWNVKNHFISFMFQSERVGMTKIHGRLDYFSQEIFGEILYHNPVVIVLILVSLISFFRKKNYFILIPFQRLLFVFALPIIFTFLFFSLFRQTLPHWNGTGYYALYIFAACYLSDKNIQFKRFKLLPSYIRYAIFLLLFIVIVGFLQIQFGIIPIKDDDFSADMNGWKKVNTESKRIIDKDIQTEKTHGEVSILTTKWFDAAHLDYYYAFPNAKKLFVCGYLKDAHKYFWINKQRSNISSNAIVYFISTKKSLDGIPSCCNKFEVKSMISDSVQVFRNNICIHKLYVFKLKKYYGNNLIELQ